MHYTSWDRTDRDNPKLLAHEGPEILGEFTESSAVVGGKQWELAVDEATGATATLEDGRVFSLPGNLKRDKRFEADLAGERFVFTNEWGKNWIVEDAQGHKVGQFTGNDNGVRKAILEFDTQDTLRTRKESEEAAGSARAEEAQLSDTVLPQEQAVALSWMARTILEFRLNSTAVAVIVCMALASVVAAVTWLI